MITPLSILATASMLSVHDTTIAVDRTVKGYSVYTPVEGALGKYAVWNLDLNGVPGMGIMREAEVRSFVGYDDSEANTYGAWAPYSMKGMYNDRVRWSKTNGAYIEYTFHSEPGQVVGLVNFKTTNGGIGAVTIDGESALANLLPEGKVDFYSASGPNPNLYKSNRQIIPVADSLPGGQHTLRIYFTGTKNPASSDTRIYSDAIAVYNTHADETDTVRGDFAILNSTPLTSGGAWESVFKVGARFFGTNQHGNETMTYSAILADGVSSTMTVHDTLTAERFNFGMTSKVEVLNFGVCANNSRIYTFTTEGLELRQGVQWLNSVPMTHIYPAMWPVLDGPEFSSTAVLDPFNSEAAPRTRFDLSRNDLYFKGGFDVRTAYLFNERNARTFTFEVTDLDNYADNPRFWVWDLGAPSYNKLYFQRQSDRYQPVHGEVWNTTARFRYYYDSARMRGGI